MYTLHTDRTDQFIYVRFGFQETAQHKETVKTNARTQLWEWKESGVWWFHFKAVRETTIDTSINQNSTDVLNYVKPTKVDSWCKPTT